MTDIATIKFRNDVLEITNPRNVQPVSADLYTECRLYNGITCLSFASIIMDGDSKPRAEIVARVRLTAPSVAALRNAFEDMLKAMMPSKETAN